MDLTRMDIGRLAGGMARGEFSCRQVTAAYLARIEAREGEVGSFLTLRAERALQEADAIDTRRAKGEVLSPLAGVPGAYKDNLCTRGFRTTCASRMLKDYIPPYSATAVEKLSDQGAVSLGKLNMDEFAMGSSCEHSALGQTKNPLDTSRVPGGSSGGSAAAVAAGEAAFSLGSDTGGSIRQPAAFCGVVGMKPTYGAVSRYGLVAFASSLDQIGPLTRTVRDNALVLSAIAGRDARDLTSDGRAGGDYAEGIEGGIRGLRIGLPRELFGEGISPDVRERVLRGAGLAEGLGAHVEELSMPDIVHALPAYYILSSAEASSNLARFDGVRYGHRAAGAETLEALYRQSRSEGFGREVKRRILLGTFVLSEGYADAYYRKAQKVRALIRRTFDVAFEKVDLLLSPTAPTVAYALGEKLTDPMAMYRGDICTVPANIAGIPALSLPCGKGEGGMPVGLQLMGRHFDERTIYRAAYALEGEGLHAGI